MLWLRSILFLLVMLIITPPFSLLCLMIFPLSRHQRYRFISQWARMMSWFIRHLLQIRYRVIGLENLPDYPAVLMSKHQSAWETIMYQIIFPPLCFVYKKELIRIPFFGWALAQMPKISIDRASGQNAMNQVVMQGCDRLKEGFLVVIFPEGTRVAAGQKARYKPGGATLAVKAGAPIVPVAHNAGEFWRKNAFVKYPGEVVVSIGPAIETEGRKISAVNEEVEAWIEGEMHRQFPHLYAHEAIKADHAA